jgi:hypothetical protein
MSKKLRITTTDDENLFTALGISKERSAVIISTVSKYGASDDCLTLSSVAAKVSETLDLTPNEIFIVGYQIGRLAAVASNPFADVMGAMLETLSGEPGFPEPSLN